MNNRISLADALVLMDEKIEGGKPNTFDVVFCTLTGEVVKLKEVVKCGLKKAHKQYIGIRTTNNFHHPFMVHIHLLMEFNNVPIYY